MKVRGIKKQDNVIHGVSLLTDHDIYLFKEGNHFGLYEKLGSHLMTVKGLEGALFAVWAPNASKVSVVGDFNGWNRDTHHLALRRDGSGICRPGRAVQILHRLPAPPPPGGKGRSLCFFLGDAAPHVLPGLGPDRRVE